MNLAGIENRESRHNNRKSSLDSREYWESSVNLLLNGTVPVINVFKMFLQWNLYCRHSYTVGVSLAWISAISLRLACATDETKLLLSFVCVTAPKSLFWASTCVPGFDNVPCQSGWKEILKALLVIHWVPWGCRTRILALLCRSLLKPRGNGPNIVGCYMLCPFAHPVACCCIKFETGQTFQATTPIISFVPWSPKHSATMLDPFAQLFHHCWGHAHSLRMVYKDLWAVSFPWCTAGPNIVGSCCICLHTTANMHATTTNIVGTTMLGVASVCTQPNQG